MTGGRPTGGRLAAVLAALALAGGIAAAGPAGAQPATRAEIIQALRPPAADAITGSRSLDSLLDDERGLDRLAPPSIDLDVTFAFDSIRLEGDTIATLEALGGALASEDLRRQTILVIGHTDGKGTAAYNDDLSRRRAAAVVAYLIDHFAIDPALISAEGRGERDPLLPDDPDNAANRRVEIRNVTGIE